jgi:phosphoenolpyruvate carboxykinase (ATP)
MKLRHTRALLTAAMCGALDGVQWATDPVFGLKYPLACPDVPSEVLDPRSAWKDAAAFDATAKHLAGLFRENFAKFEAQASAAILVAAPVA